MENFKKIIKIIAVVLGLLTIGFASHIVLDGNWEICGKIAASFSKIIIYCIPFLTKMILWSLAYIWPPIVIYIIISFITISKMWRFFLGFVALCGFFIFIYYGFLQQIKISNFYNIFMYIMQIYLLALWVVPKELWNIAGGIVWMIGSLIITIFPDLPTYFDDLGMIFGLFVFVFIYLHTVAMIVQRFVDERVVTTIRSLFGFKKKENVSENTEETSNIIVNNK